MKQVTVLENVAEILAAFGYEVTNGGQNVLKLKKNVSAATVPNNAYLRNEKGKLEIAQAPGFAIEGVTTNEFLVALIGYVGLDLRL